MRILDCLGEIGQFLVGAICVACYLTRCQAWWCCEWVLKYLRLRKTDDLSGEVVVITGAGSGLGQSIAWQLAPRDCGLVLVGKRLEDLSETEERARHLGCSQLYSYACDCSKESMIQETVRQINRDLSGKVSVLINNAGVVHSGHFGELQSDAIRDTMDVNLLAHFWLTQAFLPTLKKQRRAHIVCISSVAGLFGASGLTAYCASKSGVVGLCESLSMDLHLQQQEHVKVTCMCPYQINTRMFAGVRLTYQWMFPILDVQYVAERTIDCLFSDRHLIVMPRIMYILLVAKALVPHSFLLRSADFLGITNAMEYARKTN